MPSLRESGYSAFDCWHRFDQEYHPSNQMVILILIVGIALTKTISLQIPPHNLQYMQWWLLLSSFDLNWYSDLGATNHINPDVHNLSNKTITIALNRSLLEMAHVCISNTLAHPRFILLLTLRILS